MTEDEINQQKQITFYSSVVNAWFNTALERDKTLFTMSSAGIGVLLTLLNFGSVKGDACVAVLVVFATLSFACCIACILAIFKHNGIHIEQVIAGKAPKSDPLLAMLDGAAIWSFGLAAAFTTVIVVLAALNPFIHRETTMSEKNKVEQSGQQVHLNESYNGLTKLQGQPTTVEKSFNGAVNLQPAATPPASTPAPAQPAPAQPAPEQPAQSSQPAAAPAPGKGTDN